MGRAFEYRRAAKEKRWDKMSKIFPKLARAITLAAKEGGEDPDMNPRLRTAIQNAKSQNMPKDNIENAIKRASGNDAADYQEVTYEGKGPHGVLVFVECATDNTTRTVANVKSYFNKAGGSLVVNGSLEFMFDRKAIFRFEVPEGKDLEDLELELIDYGLQEIEALEAEEGENQLAMATADYTDFGNLSTAFDEMGIEVKKSSLERIPTSPIELSEDDMEDVEKLLDKIEDDDDVQAVFNNIA